MDVPRAIGGLRAIADRFEGYIIDQWGVMHDGRALFPGVREVFRELKARGRRIVLLSNSGRRAALNDARLMEMGLDPALVDGSVTSGEVTWQALARRTEPPFSRLGRRCFLLTRFGDMAVVEGLDLELVDDVAEADFLLITGVDSPDKTLEDYLPIVERAAARRIPAICSNPDIVAPVAGRLALAPGAVARKYEELGGPVTYIGKPSPRIYGACLALLDGIPRDRILAIGDSLAHDVKGARNAGLASCFVASGVHREELPADLPEPELVARVRELASAHGAVPDSVIRRLVW